MESINTDLVFGACGRIGDMLVFRQRGNKTYISKRPKKREANSVKQLAAQERFREAAAYAKAVLDDEVKKALYEAKASPLQSAFNLALADYLKAPQIRSVEYATYTGQVGSTISIRATDDFKVDKVTVSIKNSSDVEIESGLAVLSSNGLDWVYTAKTLNADVSGSTLIVGTSDIPGNLTTEEYEL